MGRGRSKVKKIVDRSKQTEFQEEQAQSTKQSYTLPETKIGAEDPAVTVQYIDEGMSKATADFYAERGNAADKIQEAIDMKNINVSVGIPKYEGTDAQIKYATTLAERYIYNLMLAKGNSGFNGVSSNEKKTKFEAAAKKRGFVATPQGYLEHSIKNDAVASKILSSRSASAVLDTLVPLVNSDDAKKASMMQSTNYKFDRQMRRK